jgi:hypothetical protein
MAHRTQLILDETSYGFLKREAKRAGVSISEMLRRFLRDRIQTARKAKDAEDPVLLLAGQYRSKGPRKPIGREAEDYLYGKVRS